MTMLDKLARAISLSMHRGLGYEGEALERVADEMAEMYAPEARAVLDALMEPDEGMVEAGVMELHADDLDSDKEVVERIYRSMCQAMVQRAKGE